MNRGSDDFFKQRTEDLTNLVNSQSSHIESKEKCFPTLLAVGAVVPFVVWAAFYFIKPSFVQQKNSDGTFSRNNKKVLMWTFIVTLVLWACLYLWTYCKGYDSIASICSKK